MKQIYEELGQDTLYDVPHYYDGEMFAAKGSEVKLVVEELNEVWTQSMDRFARGLIKFNEEAHMLSFIYYKLGYSQKVGNELVKRIWTKLFGYNNVDGSEMFLTVWHLPTEKKLGIRRIYKQVINHKSAFWSVPIGQPFVDYIQKSVGLPRRNLIKFILDVYDSISSKVEQRLVK